MTEGCVHHWQIETPTPGATQLAGTCRRCGATRTDFVAYMDGYEGGWGAYNERQRDRGLTGQWAGEASRASW